MNNRPSILLILIAFFSSYNHIFSQVEPKKFSSQELQEDLDKLKFHLETIQPKLYQYYPKDSLDLAFETISNYVSEPRTSEEFYRAVRLLNRYVANGHNNFFPSDEYIATLKSELPRIPFDFYYDKGQLRILRTMAGDTSIVVGDELLKVNGRSIDAVLQDMIFDMSTDGYNKSLPMWKATNRFSVQYVLKYGSSASHEMVFKDQSGEEYDRSVQALKLDEINKVKVERYGESEKPWYAAGIPAYTLEYEEDIAIMTLRTFSKSWIKQNGKPYKKFFADAFEELAAKGTKNLVIDLRSNGGGDPEPTIALFSHLYKEDFEFYEDMFTKVIRFPEPKLYKGKQWYVNLLGWALVKKRGDVYQPRYLEKTKRRRKVDDIYEGKVFVLVDPLSYSATGEMAGILKEYNRATFIGEETGGNPVTNTSGYMETLVLPNTKIQAVISLVAFDMAVKFENDGYGLKPDHEVRNSFDDELEGRDAVMDYAIKLVKKQ